eukprot:2153199-Amphidinium_carterae.1
MSSNYGTKHAMVSAICKASRAALGTLHSDMLRIVRIGGVNVFTTSFTEIACDCDAWKALVYRAVSDL